MAGLVPAIHAEPPPLFRQEMRRHFNPFFRALRSVKTWMAGTSPAMTAVGKATTALARQKCETA
jgi:hypothetical protein